jgi:hypothetical protein
VADTLAVHLSRDGPQSVAVPDAFETTGSFELAIHNHGTPAHVYVHLDDALGAVADVGATNLYVEDETTRVVAVEVADSFGTVSGTLDVVTRYGAESAPVDVTVTEPPTVTVDESLAEPQPEPPSRDLPAGSVPVVGVSVVAVVVLVLGAALMDESLVLPLGALAVAVGTVAAAYVLSGS